MDVHIRQHISMENKYAVNITFTGPDGTLSSTSINDFNMAFSEKALPKSSASRKLYNTRRITTIRGSNSKRFMESL